MMGAVPLLRFSHEASISTSLYLALYSFDLFLRSGVGTTCDSPSLKLRFEFQVFKSGFLQERGAGKAPNTSSYSHRLEAVFSVEGQGSYSRVSVENPPQHGGCSYHAHPSSAHQQFRQLACCRATLVDIVSRSSESTPGVPLGEVVCRAHHPPQTIWRISRSV